MQRIHLDGGVAAVRQLTRALADALDGGAPVQPVGESTPIVDRAPSRGALVVSTSGSTGAPKHVLLDADALRASAEATHARLHGPGRWLLATPAQYIGGIQVLVRSLLAGTTPDVLDLSRGFHTDAFAEAARRARSVHSGPLYTALVPTQLVRLLDAGAEAAAATRSFDAIIIGGAATTPDLRERAENAGVKIVRAYGMSETASGCVYDGVPLDGVHMRIGADQRVELRGDVLAAGYLRADGEVDPLPGPDGWFRTDDLGAISGGVLRVIGRADAVINSGGVKVPPAAVEHVLRGVDGVRAACVVGVSDAEWGEVVAALVVPDSTPPGQEDLVAAVRTELGKAAAPKIVRFTDALPLRGPGKVDRKAVRAALSGGGTVVENDASTGGR